MKYEVETRSTTVRRYVIDFDTEPSYSDVLNCIDNQHWGLDEHLMVDIEEPYEEELVSFYPARPEREA